MEPRVDIIVLAWGESYVPFLERCLQSISVQQEQTRVVLMSDQTTQFPDGDYELYREEFASLGELRNKSFSKIQSEYVMFLDVDDYIFPGALSRLLTALRSRPKAAACVGRQIYQYGDQFYNETWPGPIFYNLAHVPALYNKMLYFRCLFRPASATLIRSEACKSGSKWGEGSIDDWPFIIDLSRRGKIFYSQDRVGVYSKREGSGWHKPHSKKDLLAYAKDTRDHCGIKSRLAAFYHYIDASWYARGGHYDPMNYHTKRLDSKNKVSDKTMQKIMDPLDFDYFRSIS